MIIFTFGTSNCNSHSIFAMSDNGDVFYLIDNTKDVGKISCVIDV